MNLLLQRTFLYFFLFFPFSFTQAQQTITYTSSTTWTVPTTVSTITIKVYGGAGGTGGQDCGAGCSNPPAGPVGYVLASYAVTPGDVIGIYPGGKGNNGGNSVSGTGGGAAGIDTYPSANFNGGNGGNAGSSGSSGGGGSGGAASVITINSTIKIVAGGAGGGGGMANLAVSGQAGSSTASSNGTNTGGNGTTPAGDGGGGGGGGGGQFASAGGAVHPAGAESAGDGGFIGANSVSGASVVTTNGNFAWTNTGQIEITFTSTLPVTWLSFNVTRQDKMLVLQWSTVTEQNTKDFEVEHSIDGIYWYTLDSVLATGNTNTMQQYSFTDQYPVIGLNHYRLLQRDTDGMIKYSKTILYSFLNTVARLKIYPNPVLHGTTMVSLSQASFVSVYNSAGIKLMQKWFPVGVSLFDLSKLPGGNYYLKIEGEAVLFVIQ